MARPSGYVNPLSGAHVTAERIDMGVDYAGSGPVRAIGDALITGVADLTRSAWQGWWVQYKLLAGPYEGSTIYVAEGVNPVVRTGQRVPAGTPVAQIVRGSSTGIETGFGSGRIGETYAQRYGGGYSEGWRTAAGDAMSNLIASLGGPAGLVGGRPTHGTFKAAAVGASWAPCTLTWYDPALGGINTTGGADPHAKTASGEAYSPTAFTCAAPPNFPFGTMITFRYRKRTVTCRVNDRGGAITGSHFDLARAPASRLGIINAGSVHAEYSVGAAPPPSDSGSGVSRPGGSDDQGQALEDLYRAYLEEESAGDTHFAAFADRANKAHTARGVVSDVLPGAGPKTGFNILPGVGPIPGGIPGIPDFDPLAMFHRATQAIQTTGDLLKLFGWIFNPRNMLRMIEFLVGISLIYVAIRINLNVFQDATNESREAVTKVKGDVRKVRQSGRTARGRVQKAKQKRGMAKPPSKQIGKGATRKQIPAKTGKGGKAAKAGGKAGAGSRVAAAGRTAIRLVPK